MCLECTRVNNPKGWIPATCRACGRLVYFSSLDARDHYAGTGSFASIIIQKRKS